MPIANVQEEGDWIKVYDENSKKIAQMSSSGVELLGIASDFFVTEMGGWIKTFDQNCKKIAQMSSANITVISAAGQTFTTKEGSWTKTYDKNCKKISQRWGCPYRLTLLELLGRTAHLQYGTAKMHTLFD